MVRRALTLLAALAAGCASSRGSLAVDPLKAERALYDSGRYAEAAAAMTPERLRRLPRRARGDGYALLARSLQSQGRTSDALAAYQLAEGLYPKNLEVLTGLAWLLHGQGLSDRALPFFRRAAAIHPNNAAANLGLAEILAANGDLATAEDCYRRALAAPEWEGNPSVLRGFAEVLSARQKPAEAAAAVTRALAKDPSAATLLTAARIERRRGERDASYRRLAEAMATDPAREEAMLQRALWFLEDGRLPEAEADADALLSRAEGPLARWVRGAVRARRGDLAGARADLASAAAQRREAPFVARAALALLEELHAAAD